MNQPSHTAMDPRELAHLFDAIEDYAIFLLGPSGEIRSWNSGARRIMGYESDEIIGRNFSIFYGPDDQQKPRHELAVAASEGRIEDEGWRVRRDGSRFWANTIITALRNGHGEVTSFAKVTRDLTQRREAEERLRQSEEVFRLLVQSVQEYAIFLLTPTGHIATWNAGAERIKGYAPEEIIGRHFSTFYTEEDISDEKPARELEIAQQNGSVEDTGWRVRKDGSRFWANVLITAVYDQHGELRGFAKVTRDMSERKQAEELRQELFEQREKRLEAEEEARRTASSYHAMQEANRVKDEFLMTLSHELRTPMTSILGWARLLPTMPPNDPGFREAIASIGRSAQLQARIIDDVLDVSRIVSGKLRLNIEEVELARVLTASVETVRPSAEARMITITTSFGPHLGTVAADPTRLQQVVWNLLSNAVKFTPPSGRIDLTAVRDDTNVTITVRDSGEGIDPDFLPHVFENFRQAENPSTRVHGGLGIGLSIVRFLVEAHGGSVMAESAGRGKGATFTIRLPAGAVPEQAPEPSETLASPPESAGFAPQSLAGRNILIVDDDIDGRHMVRAVLRQAGASVVDVASADAALAHLSTNRPDLVITDLAMPQVDGYALAEQIRRQTPGLKIVALSAFPARRLSPEQAQLFDDFIAKPAEPQHLVDSIRRLLGGGS